MYINSNFMMLLMGDGMVDFFNLYSNLLLFNNNYLNVMMNVNFFGVFLNFLVIFFFFLYVLVWLGNG